MQCFQVSNTKMNTIQRNKNCSTGTHVKPRVIVSSTQRRACDAKYDSCECCRHVSCCIHYHDSVHLHHMHRYVLYEICYISDMCRCARTCSFNRNAVIFCIVLCVTITSTNCTCSHRTVVFRMFTAAYDAIISI